MIISIGIDGEWTARDLASTLDGLETFAGFIEKGRVTKAGEFSFNGSTVESIPGENSPSYLRITRLAYNSPGSIDLLGLGKIIEQLRLFIQFLIEHYDSRNDRELDREDRRVELVGKRADVVRKLADLHSHLVPVVEREGADALIEAVVVGRIVSVSTKASDDTA